VPPAVNRPGKGRDPGVFVFNPFAEGYIAEGKAFAPVKHQAMLAEDLANLPQFLCQTGDIVLLGKRPAESFLNTLHRAGFPVPEFVELKEGRIDPEGGLCRRNIGSLRPWAWGPDSVELLKPLFARVGAKTQSLVGSSRRDDREPQSLVGSSRQDDREPQSLVGSSRRDDRETRSAGQFFNNSIAQLYSKAWSTDFLKKVLARCREEHGASVPTAEERKLPGAEPWLCSEQEAGVAVSTLEEALEAIAAIRCRGHHRLVVKEAHGLAGHNAIRLWEPEILPAQRQWLVHALKSGRQLVEEPERRVSLGLAHTHTLKDGRQLVVEPWLERAMDFSVQLEMGPDGLRLCGYTGLINDRKGQFLANWAEADYSHSLPAKVAALFHAPQDMAKRLDHLYGVIFSMLETELQHAGFAGPVSIDAFVYRTSQGDYRLKPVVEINPRYTMGRLTVELMKHACPGSCGLFRLVTQAQARAEGFANLSSYARSLGERPGARFEGEPAPKIRQGAFCLNDPEQARVCLATFEVSPALDPAAFP